jgi:hypothetical protein
VTSTHPSSSRHHRSSPHLSPHTTFLTAYYQRNLERLWEAYPVHHYCRSWECLLCLFIPLGTIYICCNLGAREAKRQAEQEEKWADFQKEQQRKCVFQFHSFPSLIILSLPPHRSYLSHRYAPYDVDVQLLKGLPFMFAENGSIDEAKGVKRITIGLKFQSANTPEIGRGAGLGGEVAMAPITAVATVRFLKHFTPPTIESPLCVLLIRPQCIPLCILN